MLKCSEKKISECFTINKICNKLTGRCIKKQKITNEPIINKINKYRYRQKLAIFDYDWTLVKPKTNGTFSKNENDWMWLTENVPNIIKKLYDKGYSINIISNQRKNTYKKTQEINNALLNLNIPLSYIIASDNINAKPNISMFNILVNNKKWDRNKSFYVGDALGRQGDWSDVDKKFSENIGIKYYSPDELFSINTNKKKDVKIKKNKNQEIIVMVGYPGSGKSTLSKKFENDNYIVISGDKYITSKKMINESEKHLKNGLSIVYDSTNASKIKRKEYINIAKKYNINIRCINIKTDMVESMFRNNKRDKIIPKITYYVYRKRYEEPTMDEGFNEIIFY
tara:strand:+ start:76 stop:1092 length:1017 start_codon:yes stop_codon:yes gene_type:complete